MGVSYLLDTHVIIWLRGRESLHSKVPAHVRDALLAEDATAFASATSAFEVTTKYRLGKLDEARELAEDWEGQRRRSKMHALNVSTEHAVLAGRLDWAHRDPFDRLLAAQAITEGMTFVTGDRAFAAPPQGLTLLPW